MAESSARPNGEIVLEAQSEPVRASWIKPEIATLDLETAQQTGSPP